MAEKWELRYILLRYYGLLSTLSLLHTNYFIVYVDLKRLTRPGEPKNILHCSPIIKENGTQYVASKYVWKILTILSLDCRYTEMHKNVNQQHHPSKVYTDMTLQSTIQPFFSESNTEINTSSYWKLHFSLSTLFKIFLYFVFSVIIHVYQEFPEWTSWN